MQKFVVNTLGRIAEDIWEFFWGCVEYLLPYYLVVAISAAVVKILTDGVYHVPELCFDCAFDVEVALYAKAFVQSFLHIFIVGCYLSSVYGVIQPCKDSARYLFCVA